MPGMELLRFGEWAGVNAFVSARQGGASLSPYDSLNFGLHVGDDPAAVLENRRRVAEAVEIPVERFNYLRQVHGEKVAVVGEAEAGQGSQDRDSAPKADAQISNVPGVCLMVLVADCVPIVLYDPLRRAVGVVHAGWKGTAARVAVNAIERMSQEYGTRPSDLRVGIGPSIGPCHYEVGPEVRERFPDFTAGTSVDLRTANLMQLRSAGVPAGHIESMNSCTFEDDRFFSSRQDDGRTGRFAAGIALA